LVKIDLFIDTNRCEAIRSETKRDGSPAL